MKDYLDPALFNAMPNAHNVVPEDDAWLVQNMDAVQNDPKVVEVYLGE